MMHLGSVEALLLLILGVGAGWLGALVGIGGGIIVVPALVLGFGIEMRPAVAASLASVIATSTAAGSVYVGSGLTNMRLAMTLEIATTLGGITGGLLAAAVPSHVLAAIFAAMMLVTVVLTLRAGGEEPHEAIARPLAAETPIGREDFGQLAGAYFDPALGRLVDYRATRLGLGSAVSFLAGLASGLLGLGGGFLKVPAMHLGMRVPLKVAAATSNFMIGVTAVSSFFVYFARGDLHPFLACTVTLGVVAGALALGLTPVARVLALLLLWSWQRDWRFVWVSAVVIVTLTFAALVAGS